MKKIQAFTKDDFRIVSKTPLYKGFFTLNKYCLQHRKFDGGWTDTIEREIFERGHAVAVLPYDPVRQEFVMIEQFRVGALEAEQPWLLEIVAGMIDEGETPEQVCEREAQEEAGLAIQRLIPIMNYFPSPGGCTEKLHLYFAIVDASNAEGIYGLASENEDILVHTVPEKTALDWLNEGRYENSATIIGLQWFALNRDKLDSL